MHNRHPHENRYCNQCQCTTRHEIKDVAHSCQRCGIQKFPPRPVKREGNVLGLDFRHQEGYCRAV